MKKKNNKLSHEETIGSCDTIQENVVRKKLIVDACLYNVGADEFRTRLEKWRKLQNL